MKPLVALIQPRPSAAAARVDVRLATTGSGAAAGLGGVRWEMAITRRPRLTIELFTTALDGRTQVGRGDLIINLNRIHTIPDIKSYFWLGAPITIYDATNLDLATAPVEFTGYVRTTSYDVDTDQLTLNFEVSTAALDRPVLLSEFGGGGGLDGDAALRGTLLPAGFGFVQNVEPVWFDNTNNIGMIDGYGNCTAISALFEGGNDFGAKVADYANYATLLARIIDHTVAPGRWATCVAQGLVGLGAPPQNPITVDATFGANRPGALIQRLLNIHAGIALGDIDVASLAALDVIVDRPVHHWMSEARTVRDLVEAIAASCNATLLGTFQGKYSVTRAFDGAIAATINRQAPTRATRVTKWRALDPDIPTWRMRARTARPGVTLTIDQLNYADTLIDRGVYAVGTVYRQGNLVWSVSGAQYLYINSVPAAGQALPVSPALANAYWSQTKPPTTAADLTYADGTPLEDLKPADAGATLGADINSNNLFDTGGATPTVGLPRNEVKTPLGTAAAIAGQGPLATASSANLDTQVANGTTYHKVLASQVDASGTPLLSVAGSGVQVGDQRNLPAITAASLGYAFTGAITYTATAPGPTAIATISVAAGQFKIGSTSVAIGAMSANVSAPQDTLVIYQLYIVNPTMADGTFSLVATDNPDDVVSGDGRMWVGTCYVGYPAFGSGITANGDGYEGGGGGVRQFNDPTV